jgi:hypothetical protein
MQSVLDSERNVMKKGRVVLIIVICAAAFTGMNVLAQYMMDMRLSQITGYAPDTVEYVIAKHFELLEYPNTEFDYVMENGVAFAITKESNQLSKSVAVWESSEGQYKVYPKGDPYILGESMASLQIGDSVDGAELFAAGNGKFIFTFRLDGYSLSNASAIANHTIDISKANIYDNSDNELKHIDNVSAKYYYIVFDEFPEELKIYMEYEGEEYLILDANDTI